MYIFNLITNIITILRSYCSVNKISKFIFYIQNTQMSTKSSYKCLNIFLSNFTFGDAAIISADIVTSSCSLLVSSTLLRVFAFRQLCYSLLEREREKRRAKTLLKLLSRDYTRGSYIVNRIKATEIFDSSPGNSKNSSTFKPSKPSRLRPSTDSGLL